MKKFFISKAKGKATDAHIIDEFPIIREFGHQNYSNIQTESLKMHYNKGIEICFVDKGRYDWNINEQCYHVFPNNGFVTCPWEWHGSVKEVVDWGEIYWLILSPLDFTKEGKLSLADWTRFSEDDLSWIGTTFIDKTDPILYKAQNIKEMFLELYFELEHKKPGYKSRVYNIIENLLIDIARRLDNQYRETIADNKWISALEEMLQRDISRKWKLTEMASSFKMGTTTFNEKVKMLSGFTPASFLINLRVEKAKKELLQTKKSLTKIALECGFYSSQHFSSTFSRRTGQTPRQYRKT